MSLAEKIMFWIASIKQKIDGSDQKKKLVSLCRTHTRHVWNWELKCEHRKYRNRVCETLYKDYFLTNSKLPLLRPCLKWCGLNTLNTRVRLVAYTSIRKRFTLRRAHTVSLCVIQTYFEAKFRNGSNVLCV